MDKCEKCNLGGISRVLFHDRVVDNCSDCDYIRVSFAEYEGELINNCVYDLNKFGVRGDFPDSVSLENLRNKMKVDSAAFIELSTTKKCNVCGDSLLKLKVGKKMEMYLCNYCNSLYFKRESFDEEISRLAEKEEKKSFFKRIWDYIFKRS